MHRDISEVFHSVDTSSDSLVPVASKTEELSELFDKPTAYGLTVTHESTHTCAHTV